MGFEPVASRSAGAEAPLLRKFCLRCGTDVTHKPRYRKHRGLYYCKPCYKRRRARRRVKNKQRSMQMLLLFLILMAAILAVMYLLGALKPLPDVTTPTTV